MTQRDKKKSCHCLVLWLESLAQSQLYVEKLKCELSFVTDHLVGHMRAPT